VELTIEPPYLIVRPFATEDDFYREAVRRANAWR
jgi:hypothetical protein